MYSYTGTVPICWHPHSFMGVRSSIDALHSYTIFDCLNRVLTRQPTHRVRRNHDAMFVRIQIVKWGLSLFISIYP